MSVFYWHLINRVIALSDASRQEYAKNFSRYRQAVLNAQQFQFSVSPCPTHFISLCCSQRYVSDVLLTVHLSIFISVINQLDAQNFVLQ